MKRAKLGLYIVAIVFVAIAIGYMIYTAKAVSL